MNKVWSIPGGVHPPENKKQSLQLPLGQVSLPKQMILPLSQHIGAPAKPIVKVGERVLTGQTIAEANGAVSVPIHASTSGIISAIEKRPVVHPSGMLAECIVLEPDGLDEWFKLEPCEDYTQLDNQALLEKIRGAGIAGMGGAGFPAAIKLNPRPDQKINTLIINGTECEPYITADDTLMRLRPDDIVQGVQILARLLNNPKDIIIGVEDNKPEAINSIKKATAGSNIRVAVFPTKYPSGGEKQLIKILTNKEVPSGSLPADLGIVCQNIGSTAAIYRAIVLGEPLISRITTIVGKSLNIQRNVEVRLGTPIEHLLTEHGFDKAKSSRLIAGGPMMGVSVSNEVSPVVKTTNCVLAPSNKELPAPSPAQDCIRCGMCSQACPAGLMPQQLYWYAKAKDYDRLKAHNLFDCIECGACSYVCPSAIPLVQYYRASKGGIRLSQQDHIKSERSRELFENRQSRLVREAEEKEAKKLARKRQIEKKQEMTS